MAVLNGKDLTIEQVLSVAYNDEEVSLDEEAFQDIIRARKVVEDLAEGEQQIYGLNTGVGANKDRRITEREFHQFNERILFSHSVGLPPFADRATVRASMLLRLNTFMVGISGISPEIPILIKDMLNNGIHPQMPTRGSVGMADLGIMAYMGLALIGKGTVEYRGELIPAKDALDACGLKPCVLKAKDGLPLVSNNSFSMARAVILIDEMEKLTDMSEGVYALCLESQEYNPVFLDKRMYTNRDFEGDKKSLAHVIDCMEGSEFWTRGVEDLEGSISFKSAASIYGVFRDALEGTKALLIKHMNSSEDCPVVLLESGEMISTDNFIVTDLAVEFEKLDILLSHISQLIVNRILRIDDEHFSDLPRFLRPKEEVISYATILKTISTIDSEIRLLANPVSIHYQPTSNNTEDHGCNTPLVMQKTDEIVDLLRYLVGIEAMHGAQAADLRGGRPGGKVTGKIYDAVRQEIPFLEEDNRDLGKDMVTAHDMVRDKKRLF